MSDQIRALPEVACFYETDWSKYPERIKVTMSNGHVIPYRIDIPRTTPALRKMLDKFGKTCGGGQRSAPGTNDD